MSRKINIKSEEKKESNDFAKITIEKIKWYFEHKNELNKIRDYKKYLEEMKATAQMIKEKTWAGKKLCENGYEIFDLKQANDDFRKLMNLDRITEIAGVYKEEVSGQKVHKIVSITKTNFYNAFYEPIWQNLTDSEKIKSLEWMFEDINEKYKFGIKELSYFAKLETFDDYETLLGSYDQEPENELYLSLNNLNSQTSPYLLIEVLAHELTHARQRQLARQLDPSKKHTFAEISNTELGNFDFVDLGIEMHIDEATSYALYRTSQSEKMAEINGLKFLKKYIELNEKCFGKNEDVTKKFDRLKHQILFKDTTVFKDSLNREHFTGTSGILTNEKVILKGQSETLLKLIMLKNFYENKILEYYDKKKELENEVFLIRNYFKKDRISKEEWVEKTETLEKQIEESIANMTETREEIKYVKSVFMETLEKGALPKYFDIKEFDVLNILDEPKSEYVLPEWLREDEIAFNKKLEKETAKLANKDKSVYKKENIEENKEIT